MNEPTYNCPKPCEHCGASHFAGEPCVVRSSMPELPPLLSSLTPDDKTRLLAELAEIIVNGEIVEGYCWYKGFIWSCNADELPHEIWNPFANPSGYAIIIPLRVKVINTPDLKVKWLNAAREIITRRIPKPSDFDIACINADEDCDAVLIATGRARL